MRGLVAGVVIAVLCVCSVQTTVGNIIWGYEDWQDTTPADGQIDEWGRWQTDFLQYEQSGETAGYARITFGLEWGKVYYGSGVNSTNFDTHRYFFIDLWDVQGDVKLAVSGDGDADYWEFQMETNLVASGGPQGDSTVIYNPGQYVYDLAPWDPAGGPHANVSVQMIGEGSTTITQGFRVRRLFITDDLNDTPFGEVPEPSTALFVALGLMGGLIARKRAHR